MRGPMIFVINDITKNTIITKITRDNSTGAFHCPRKMCSEKNFYSVKEMQFHLEGHNRVDQDRRINKERIAVDIEIKKK